MFLHNVSYFDGAVGVTQWYVGLPLPYEITHVELRSPIPVNASFTYEIPTGDQTGTYWVYVTLKDP